MRVDSKKREISLKIVYYGPGLSGKTTNLKRLHRGIPAKNRGELVVLDTETERTLLFDYFPQTLGQVGGFTVKMDFFSVPGQSFYQRTRSLVLRGADGVVFVADSESRREAANLVSLRDLQDSLQAAGRAHASVPVVFQWNKQDLRGAISPKTLSAILNPEGHPAVPAIASMGQGVQQTQELIVGLVLDSLRARAAQRAG